MNRTTLIATLVASLALGSAAFADQGGRGHDYNRGHDHGHDYDRDRSRAYHGERRDFERRDFRPYARESYRAPERYRGYDHDRYYRPYGYYSHRWSRGERLPLAFYARSYVVDDFYGYGLYAPPRGYHWVRVDGDAVLAAVATGIVLDTVFHTFDYY